MAKIKHGSLVLDDGDRIIFTDSSDVEHEIYFDDLLQRFIMLGDLEVENFIDVTDSVIDTVPPTVNDDGYRIPTMWVDTNTSLSYICTNNTSGAAIWTSLTGGGSGSSLTIKDEGSVVDTNVSSINFIGDTVQVIPDSPGEVTIYIPSLSFVSHWNTDDGNDNNTVSDTSTTPRLLSNGSGRFNVPSSWVEGSVRDTVNGIEIPYNSPNKCSFDNNQSDFIVNIRQDGSIIRTHTLSNINGNIDVTSGDIRIEITGWEVEYFKFKAFINIMVNIGTILPQSGQFSVEMIHDSGGSSFTKIQNYIMFDADTLTPSVSGISINEGTVSSNKYLSGIRYYDVGDSFDIGISDIDNMNDSTYLGDFIYVNTNNEYGITNYYLNGSELTNWDMDWDNNNASYTDTKIIDRINFRYIGSSANISARYIDWVTGSYTNSSNSSILVDTYNITSTDNEEHFNDESRRITTGYASWVSSNVLGSDDLMVIGGELKRQYGDWTVYNPVNTANYSSALDQVFIRGYRHNQSHSNGKIYIPNITEQNIIDNYIIIEISMNGTDWFDATSPYISGILNDGDGCRTNIGVTDLPYIDFTLGTGGFTDASSGPDGWGIYMKITIPNGSSIGLTELNITDWI